MSKKNAVITGLTVLAGLASPITPAKETAASVLEEIIVTSQKREQSLQDVPVSVLALTGEELQATGSFNFEDYATKIPNLSFGAQSGGGMGRTTGRNIAIRGISGDSTSALYIDEIPLPEAIDLKIIDVSRVEVLRGPQGTLYGASSMGGALRIISNQPDLAGTSGQAGITLSSVDEGDENYRFDGAYNLPLVDDKLALRVAGFYDFQSGIYDRTVTDPASAGSEENVDDTDTFGVHVSLASSPTDNLMIIPKIIYQKVESDGFPWADADIDNFDQTRIHGVEEPLEDELIHTSLTVNYDLAWGQLISATSYVEREAQETEDFTEFAGFGFGLAPPPPSPIEAVTDFDKFVQEIRFASALGGPFQFVAGVYYSKEDSDTSNRTSTPGFEAYAANQFGLPIGTPVFGGTDLIFGSATAAETEEYAVFGEVSYDLNDAWTATIGLRYYDTSLELDYMADGIVNGGPSQFKEDLSEDGINPKVSLSYQHNEDVMVYATAAKGYRAGGFNTNAQGVSNFCAADLAALGLDASPDTFDEDSLWSYELGSKTTWADGRVRLNGALFFVKWDDLQQTVNLDCGFNVISNVGEAESRGFEMELTARPLEALNLSLGVGYTDATIIDAGGNPNASNGDRILEVPEWTFNGSAEYVWDLESGASLSLRADYQGATESFTDFDTSDPLRKRAKFNVFDLRLTYVTDRWQAAIFADNLNDERINFSDGVSLAAEVPGRPRIATNRPRTIGLSVKTFF